MAERDREIEQTEKAESASASKLFGIRQVICGLFTLYGVLVAGAGVFDGDASRKKASGIDINLWTGLGMLALGLAMLLWMRLSPHTGAPATATTAPTTTSAARPADDGSRSWTVVKAFTSAVLR